MPAVSCPQCGKSGKVPDHFHGKKIKCPQCASTFLVGQVPEEAKIPEVPKRPEPRFLDLARFEIAPDILQLVPELVARENGVLPLRQVGNTLHLAMSDVNRDEVMDKLRFILNLDIEPVMARPEEIIAEIDRRYGILRKPALVPTSPEPPAIEGEPAPKPGFWSRLFGGTKPESIPLDLPEEESTLVFGPFAESVAAELLQRGPSGAVLTQVRVEAVTHPPRTLKSVTLIFAHCIPARDGRGKTEQDMQEWALKLVERTGLTPAAFRTWVIEWHGDASDNQVNAHFRRKGVSASECLQLAQGLERSFTKNGGKPFYRKGAATPPPPPAVFSTFVSGEEVERIDQEMGELYLHCPKCAAEERVNDMGKLMLSKGNNVFARYKCKGCSTVFDGTQHIRRA